MQAFFERQIWLRHVVVAVLYFVGYMALRHVSFDFWFLPADLRLLCLLFVPYRYWVALAVGETMGLGSYSYQCYEEMGLGAALLNLVPRIALGMPIVRWCRNRLSLLGPKQQIRMNVLMLCTLLLSVQTAAYDWFFQYITPVPAGQDEMSFLWAQRYFLGNYLGILTVMPLALMLWQTLCGTSWRSIWARLCSSRLVMDSVAMLLVLLMLMWIAVKHAKSDLGDVARMAMFLPVVGLAMRNGWRGVALGGSIASVAIALVMSKPNDPVTMRAEVFMSFAITTLLMLGARISTLHAREEKERTDGRLALQAAQQGLYLGELRMQHAADTIEQIGESIYGAHERLLGHLRAFMPVTTEEKGLVRQGISAQHEVFCLADGIYPRALSVKGLSHVLRFGSIAHAFDSVDVAYSGLVTGSDLADLAAGTQLAVYRLACESAVYLYDQATLFTVHLRVRSGVTKGRRWVALRIESVHETEALGLMPSRMACDKFAHRLGASRRGVNALRDFIRIYSGLVHVRSTAQGTRLALLLHDAAGVPDRVN